MWLSNADLLKYPTYPAALQIATAAGHGVEFQVYCDLLDADTSDTSRELCRGWDFWRRQYAEIPAFVAKSSKVAKTQISFTTGIATVACKSDVCWAQGLLIATHYGIAAEYRSRNGYPTENLQGLDAGFWTWADRHQIAADACVKIWNAPPILEWVDFRAECIEGSDITPEMFDLNVKRIVNSGYDADAEEIRYEVLETLNIPSTRFFEGDGDTWNRPGDKFGGEIYAFISDRSGFFNAKPRIPLLDREKGKYRKYESYRKEIGTEGNRIFYPNVTQAACDLLVENFGLESIVNPVDYWEFVLANPKLIPVGIAEGAKKAISLTGSGLPCVAVLGVTNWSVSGSHPRLLLPELAQLAVGDRQIDIWYDMDDPDEKIVAFLNGKAQAWKLTYALKGAGANVTTRPMFWDLTIGKGIDDAKASIRARDLTIEVGIWELTIERWVDVAQSAMGLRSPLRDRVWDLTIGKWLIEAQTTIEDRDIEIREWLFDTIKYSREREIYAQTSKAYQLDPKRPIHRDTTGDYLPGEIELVPGHITAIIADTGSGKTHQINRIVQKCKLDNTIAIIFTPTNKLGEQAAYNFGIPHRNILGEDGEIMCQGDILSEARRCGGLVICPDSLEWARMLIKNHPNYIAVCDEAAKVLEHLSSGATIKDRYAEINTGFAQLLQGAQAAILAEAKISEADLVAFEKLSNKPTLVYRHRRETAKREIKIFTGAPGAIVSAAVEEIGDRLERGENVLIPTDSQRMAEKIERYLQQRFPGMAGMRNDASTSYLPAVKTLTRTPNSFLAQHQLRYLLLSPVCKAGWDLKGFDVDSHGVCHNYHFDAVCAVFVVLPTSDQVQMVARYRPNVPLSIACPESIPQLGDELYNSKKVLKLLRSEELTDNAKLYKVRLDRDRVSPLQTVLDDIYVHNTVRNGLEKSISRFSLQQRLIDDGHNVRLVPVSMVQLKESDPDRWDRLQSITTIFKDLGEQIDREWADLIAGVALRLEDDLKEAARLDRLDAPTPAQRAKAAKIRLEHKFPGVDFTATTAYHATRKYGKLAHGVDLHAKIPYLELVRAQQQERNTAILNEEIYAVHHFSREVQRIKLMLCTGILDLLAGEYHQNSPELVELKVVCLKFAKEFKQFFGLTMNEEQNSTQIYCKLLSKIGLSTLSRRPGTGSNRARLYRVATLVAIDGAIELRQEQLDLLKNKLAEKEYTLDLKMTALNAKHQKHLDRLQRVQMRNQSAPTHKVNLGLERKYVSWIDKTQVKLAELPTKLDRLRHRITRIETGILPRLVIMLEHEDVRAMLYDAATKRLLIASTTLINGVSITFMDAIDPDPQIAEMEQLNLDFKRKTG